jgi:hypothetical protein
MNENTKIRNLFLQIISIDLIIIPYLRKKIRIFKCIGKDKKREIGCKNIVDVLNISKYLSILII